MKIGCTSNFKIVVSSMSTVHMTKKTFPKLFTINYHRHEIIPFTEDRITFSSNV